MFSRRGILRSSPIAIGCISARLAAFFAEHYVDFSPASIRVIGPNTVEMDLAAAGVHSELYPLARVLQVVGTTRIRKPRVMLTPPGVWGINNCNVFETLDRLDCALEHIFLTQLRPAAFITVREMVDRVLAFFVKYETSFPEFRASSVCIQTDHTFPSSNFEYAVIHVDETTVLTVHNDWNIPLSNLSVYTIKCCVRRVHKKRQDCVLVTELDDIESQLVDIFFEDECVNDSYMI
jgi:hypothetical protein